MIRFERGQVPQYLVCAAVGAGFAVMLMLPSMRGIHPAEPSQASAMRPLVAPKNGDFNSLYREFRARPEPAVFNAMLTTARQENVGQLNSFAWTKTYDPDFGRFASLAHVRAEELAVTPRDKANIELFHTHHGHLCPRLSTAAK